MSEEEPRGERRYVAIGYDQDLAQVVIKNTRGEELYLFEDEMVNIYRLMSKSLGFKGRMKVFLLGNRAFGKISDKSESDGA